MFWGGFEIGFGYCDFVLLCLAFMFVSVRIFGFVGLELLFGWLFVGF